MYKFIYTVYVFILDKKWLYTENHAPSGSMFQRQNQ